MTGDMRGLFVIVRGQYKHNKGRAFTNRVSGNTNYLGGYDPSDSTNPEWYMLYERETAQCLSCGSDLEHTLSMVYTYVYRNKHKSNLFKEVFSPDHTRYPIDEALMHEVIDTYGYYYEDQVEEQVDLAYTELKKNSTQVRCKKKLKTRKKVLIEEEVKSVTPSYTHIEKEELPFSTKHTSGEDKTPRRKVKMKPKHRNIKVAGQ